MGLNHTYKEGFNPLVMLWPNRDNFGYRVGRYCKRGAKIGGNMMRYVLGGMLGVVLLATPAVLQAAAPSAASAPVQSAAAASAADVTYADLATVTAFFLCGNQQTTCDKEAASVIQNCIALKNQLGGNPATPVQIDKLVKAYPTVADGLQIVAWSCVAERLYFAKMGLKPGEKISLKEMQDLAMKMSGGKALVTTQNIPKCEASTSADKAINPLSCPLPAAKGPVGGPPAGGGPAPVDPMMQRQMGEGGGSSGGLIQPNTIKEVPSYMQGVCFGIDPSKIINGIGNPAPEPKSEPAPAPTPAPAPEPKSEPTPAPTPGTPAPAPGSGAGTPPPAPAPTGTPAPGAAPGTPTPGTPLPPAPAGGLPSSSGVLGGILDKLKELMGSDLGKSVSESWNNRMPTAVITLHFLPNPDSDTIDKCRDQFTSNMAGCLGAGDFASPSTGDWMCGRDGSQASYVADAPGGGGTAMPDSNGGGGMTCTCKGGGKSDDGKDNKKGGGSDGKDCCPDYCKTAAGGAPGGGFKGDVCNNCSGSCSNAPSGGKATSLVEDCLSGKAMSNPVTAKQCGIINPSPIQNVIQPIDRLGMPGSFIEQWTVPRRGSQSQGQSPSRTPDP